MNLSIGSLFSGIGGFELGLERAGLGPTRWQIEIDPYCRSILEKHWPNAERYDDIREIQPVHDISCDLDEDCMCEPRSPLEPVSIMCGGFPCQDISVAGNREGIAGERSGLWSEYARLVGLVRPRYVLVENVSALLVRGMDVVLGDLATLGYDAIWDCLPAQAIGAPHRRDRLFVVAWRIPDAERDRLRDLSKRGRGSALAPDGGNAFAVNLGSYLADCYGGRREGERVEGEECRPEREMVGHVDASGDVAHRCSGSQLGDSECARRQGLSERELHDERQAEPSSGCQGVADAERDRPQGVEQAGTAPRTVTRPFTWPPPPGDLQSWGRVSVESQPKICRVAHGIPDRVARLRALGNAIVPQCAEVIGRIVMEMELSRTRENPVSSGSDA